MVFWLLYPSTPARCASAAHLHPSTPTGCASAAPLYLSTPAGCASAAPLYPSTLPGLFSAADSTAARTSAGFRPSSGSIPKAEMKTFTTEMRNTPSTIQLLRMSAWKQQKHGSYSVDTIHWTLCHVKNIMSKRLCRSDYVEAIMSRWLCRGD